MSDDDPPDGFMTRIDCLREMTKLSDQLDRMDGKLDTIIELKVKVDKLEKKDDQMEQDKREKKREISGWMLVLFGAAIGFAFQVLATFIHI
jgi:hypothetical protein